MLRPWYTIGFITVFRTAQRDLHPDPQGSIPHNTTELIYGNININKKIQLDATVRKYLFTPVQVPVPEAAVTVFSTPYDGCCDTRNM